MKLNGESKTFSSQLLTYIVIFRNKLTELNQREQREIESERKRRVREMKLRRYLQEHLPEETPRESPMEKKKKNR